MEGSMTSIRSPHSSEIARFTAPINPDAILTTARKKKEPGRLNVGAEQAVVTNMHGVSVPEDFLVYRNDITIQAARCLPDKSERIIDLTKKAKSDSIVTDRKDLCRSVFRNALRQYPGLGKLEDSCYDLQSTLFTKHPIPEELTQICLPVNDRRVSSLLNDASPMIGVKPVAEGRTLDASTLRRNNTDSLIDSDHCLQQYLELLTSQSSIMDRSEHVTYPGGKSYLINPERHGFTRNDIPDVGGLAYLAIGCQKSIRFVEGKLGAGHKRVALVVDTKKSLFHRSQLLTHAAACLIQVSNRVLSPSDITHLRTAFQGLSVTTTHEHPPRTITIHNISSFTARTKCFRFKDVETTVEKYFMDRYSVALNFPDWPLIVENGPNKNEFPFEVLMISDNQRIRTEHQTPELVQKMIRSCAVPPATLIPQNMKNVEALSLCDSNLNPHLKSAGVTVRQEPVRPPARVLPAPLIQCYDRVVTPDGNRAVWQQQRYLLPVPLGKWAFYILGKSSGRYSSFGSAQMRQFLHSMSSQCSRVGMEFRQPEYFGELSIDADAVEAEFQACQVENYDFMFFVHSDQDQSMHKVVKLFERKYEIPTQLVRMQNAGDIISKGKQTTMENIVNKMNIKLGGVNYGIRLSNAAAQNALGDTTLCIGLALNHPGAINPNLRSQISASPTVVGYAANDKEEPYEFVGGFRLQKASKDERVHVLHQIVVECIERFQQNRRKNPERIFIFRYGCSEGQFQMVLHHELPFVMGAIRDTNIKAGVTLIVPNRMHNLRFMLADAKSYQRAPEQNVRPGTIVDTFVVHPENNEFYLNSHVTLQGTAKTPRYTTLYDDNKLDNDTIQLLCYSLCFGHQIVRLPTSLPSPVYIAGRYAERGRALLNICGSLVEANALDDEFAALANGLPYFKSPKLRNVRINA